MTLDTRAFHDPSTGVKLGIGSSAALAVALSAAFRRWRDAGANAGDAATFDAALAAHTAFQSGSGSGVDVATAWRGGLVVYRRGSLPETARLTNELTLKFLWSGRAADTARRLQEMSGRNKRAVDHVLASTAAAVTDRVLDAASAAEVLAALAEFVAALKAWDVDAGRDVFTDGHDLLMTLAKPIRDLVYKPCGAGGGDIGMAASTSQESLQRFQAEAERAGFVALDLCLEAQGVLVEAG